MIKSEKLLQVIMFLLFATTAIGSAIIVADILKAPSEVVNR